MSQSCLREIWGEPPQFSMGLLGVDEGMWVDGIARELSETMKLKARQERSQWNVVCIRWISEPTVCKCITELLSKYSGTSGGGL